MDQPDPPSGLEAGESPSAPEPVQPLNPQKKKWLLIQIAGGFVAVAGILLTTYDMAKAAQARAALQVPKEAYWILLGVAIHVVGRIGARRVGP